MQAASQQCVQALMQDMSLTTVNAALGASSHGAHPGSGEGVCSPPANTASPHARRGILSSAER